MTSPRQRARRLWPQVTLGVIVVLVVGVFIGGHPGWMPSWFRGAFAPQTEAEKQVDQVLGLIGKNYYRPVNVDKLANTGLSAAVASLQDPYSHYYAPTQEQQFQQETNPTDDGGIGIEVGNYHGKLLISEVFPGSPAAGAGLVMGDLIVAVNGHSLKRISFNKAAGTIRGSVGTKVKLTIQHGKHQSTLTIERQNVTVPVVYSKLIHYHGVKLGYLDYAQFTPGSSTVLRKQLQTLLKAGAQGLVLDLRDNPGGLVAQAIDVASLFIQNGTIVTTKGRNQPTTVYTALGNAIAPKIPMTVLVDRGTASSAEIVTAALQQHGRAKVVGTRTYGKGVFQESQTTDGGGTLDITVGQFYTPDGANLGGSKVAAGKTVARGPGIKPNLYVADNPDDPGPAAPKAAEKLLAQEIG
jgi:carboxyl-terminal processing protease